MSTIAELLVHVGVKDDIDKGMTSARDKISAGADKMVKTGSAMSKRVTLPIIGAGAALFALAGQGEEAQAKLKSSFDSMGASAFTSIDKLNAHAEALQDATTFDDEAIAEYQSVLLTFGNVTGDVFEEATALGLDMSAKLGTDLQSTSIQIGKALNDPIKGVSALSRVGVSFTEQQKEQIKAMAEGGDMAGAQAMILGELQKQFGGTAEAMAQTGTGKAKQAMNALANAGESIGSILIPVVSKAAGWLKNLAERFQNLSPEAQKWILTAGGIVAAIGPVLVIGGKLIKSFMAVGKAFSVLSKLLMANPWVLLIAAVIALVVIIVKNWDTIVAFLTKVWDWIKNAAGAVGQWISDAFNKAVEFVKGLFLNFTPLGLIIKNFDKIKELATGVWQWIKDKFQAVIDFLVGIFTNFTPLGLIISNFDTIKDVVTGVKDWIVDKFNAVVDFFKGLPSRIGSAVAGMWDGIKNAFRSAINWVIDKWNNFSFSGGFNLPSIFGGGRVQVGFDTPNIPRLHDGGIFNAPNGREGLALLEDGERVTPAKDASAGFGPQITIQGDVYGYQDFVRKVRDANVDINKLGFQT